MKKMLLVFAHPDDESFFVGGTVAAYAARGWHIELICVTSGEGRDGEVERAGKVLGIQHIQFLHQPDGQLKSVTPGTLEDLIVKKMEEFMPDIVITHDTTGITNHPDHIKVCYATTFAFQKYIKQLEEIKMGVVERKGRGYVWKEDAFKRAFGDVDPENKDPKLYYTCVPKSIMRYMQKMHEMPEELHGNLVVGTEDKMVTTCMNIQENVVVKGKALLCHETQQKLVNSFINFDTNPLHKQEYFVLRMQGVHEVFMGKNDRVADAL